MPTLAAVLGLVPTLLLACNHGLESSCGDGVIDVFELCDDGPGNGRNGRCTTGCERVRCGDGLLSPEAGESCDDGNLFDGDSCPGDCGLCGNGRVDGLESCDDGNSDPSDGCNRCRLPGEVAAVFDTQAVLEDELGCSVVRVLRFLDGYVYALCGQRDVVRFEVATDRIEPYLDLAPHLSDESGLIDVYVLSDGSVLFVAGEVVPAPSPRWADAGRIGPRGDEVWRVRTEEAPSGTTQQFASALSELGDRLDILTYRSSTVLYVSIDVQTGDVATETELADWEVSGISSPRPLATESITYAIAGGTGGDEVLLIDPQTGAVASSLELPDDAALARLSTGAVDSIRVQVGAADSEGRARMTASYSLLGNSLDEAWTDLTVPFPALARVGGSWLVSDTETVAPASWRSSNQPYLARYSSAHSEPEWSIEGDAWTGYDSLFRDVGSNQPWYLRGAAVLTDQRTLYVVVVRSSDPTRGAQSFVAVVTW